jgi:threonine dehydrogenase-like Zn-dependent dehydrogenase
MNARSIEYQADGAIKLVEVSVPEPGPDEIQVQGLACGICSWDIGHCKLGEKMKATPPPGHEGVGRIVKLGANVTNFAEGDRVASGGFQTLHNQSATRVHKLPDSSLPDEHWIVEPVSCAVTGLDHCRLESSKRVVLIGCGFMGLLILQGLVRSDAEIIGIDIDQKRLDLAKSLGLREAHNVATTDADVLCQDLEARYVDVVVDTSGSQQGLDMATKIVRPAGIINLFGWIKGEAASFAPTAWHMKGFTLVNSSPSAQIREPFEPAIQMIHEGYFDLAPLVSHVVTLDEYPALMQRIVQGDPDYVKGVVRLVSLLDEIAER